MYMRVRRVDKVRKREVIVFRGPEDSKKGKFFYLICVCVCHTPNKRDHKPETFLP